MPHGWKYLMDTTTETRIYNLARKNYLDGYHEYEKKPWVEYIGHKTFVHSKARKKRKWLKPRTVEKLPPAIADGTHVLVKNPYPYNSWCFPTTPSDFSDIDVVGIIKGFLPPAEEYYKWRTKDTDPPRYPGRYFSRVRKYRVMPIVGSSKGRILQYPGDMLTIVPPGDLSHLLFVMQIRAMKGEI